jgi:hypothetical protein
VPLPVWLFLLYIPLQGALVGAFRGYIFYAIAALSIFALSVAYVSRPDDFLHQRWPRAFFFWLTFLQLGEALLQWLGFDPIFATKLKLAGGDPVHWRFAGFLGQHTIFGAWAAAIAWYWWGRGERVAFVLVSLFAFATQSAFTLLSWYCAGLAWLAWRGHWRWFGLGCLGILGGAFLALHHEGGGFLYDNGRFFAWRMLISGVFDRPWLGYGMGDFGTLFPTYHQGFSGMPWRQAHNEFLQVLYDGGLIGLGLALATLAPLLYRAKQWWRREDALPWFLLLVAILVNSTGNFPLQIAPLALYAGTAYLWLVARPLEKAREGKTV